MGEVVRGSYDVGVALVEIDPGEDLHGGGEGVAALGDDEVDGLRQVDVSSLYEVEELVLGASCEDSDDLVSGRPFLGKGEGEGEGFGVEGGGEEVEGHMRKRVYGKVKTGG